MAGNIFEIDDSQFDDTVLKSNKPVVVDFWAPWCGPCKALGPVVEQLAEQYAGRVEFAKCNVDNNPVTPGKFGIKAIPTLMFFNNGQVVEQITGVVSRDVIEKTLDKVVNGGGGTRPFMVV